MSLDPTGGTGEGEKRSGSRFSSPDRLAYTTDRWCHSGLQHFAGLRTCWVAVAQCHIFSHETIQVEVVIDSVCACLPWP